MIRTDPVENELTAQTGSKAHNGEKRSVSWWWLAPFLFAIVAFPFLWRMAGLAHSSLDAPSAIAPVSSQLGFSAKHEESDWRLVWSRAALSRLGAVGAVLTIRDGGSDRLQFLSARDLEAGAILYVPRTADLVFNLKVSLLDGLDIEEQIRVLGAEQGPEQTESTELTIPPRRNGEGSSAALSSAASSRPGRQPLRQFQAPPRAVRPAESSADASVALPEIRLPAAPASMFPLPQPPPAQRPSPPPNQPVTPPPAPAAEQPSAPPAGAATRIDPSPLRSPAAAWPRNASRQSGVDVRIRVQIDTRGTVIGVAPFERTIANFQFVDSALAAARMWLFSPALENGNPVPSESVLTFKFTP